MNPRSILVADELLHPNEATQKRSGHIQQFASDLSEYLKIPTDLIFVRPMNQEMGNKLFSDEQRKKSIAADQEKFAPVMSHFQRPGKLIIKQGWPVEEIVKLVHKENRFDSLVLGTRTLQGLERFFLGSVAEEVVRSVKRPVFILGPAAQKENYRLPRSQKLNFLVATDLTKKCRAVETYAVSLAKITGARVTFYYSLAETLKTAQQFAAVAGEVISSFDSIYADIKKDALVSMAKKVDRLKAKGVDCDSYIENEFGDFTQGVLAHSRGTSHLIFMGHQSHGMIATAFLGSNFRSMVANSKVPVVVVRS